MVHPRDAPGPLRGYRHCRAGTHPTAKERGEGMYLDFDNGLAKERAAQLRAEVSRNRLAAHSARDARTDRGGGIPGGRVARGFALVAGLLGAHPTP
jgi:hypothetical protein